MACGACGFRLFPEVQRCCSKLLAPRASITERCAAGWPWSPSCDAAHGRNFADLGASRRGWDWPGTYDEYHGFNSRPPKFFSNDLTKFLELKVVNLALLELPFAKPWEGPFGFFSAESVSYFHRFSNISYTNPELPPKKI